MYRVLKRKPKRRGRPPKITATVNVPFIEQVIEQPIEPVLVLVETTNLTATDTTTARNTTTIKSTKNKITTR